LRVLFLTQILPYPLNSGAKIRAYYVLRHLSQRHQVTLVSFVRPDDDKLAADHLRSFCEAVHVVPMVRSRLKNITAMFKSFISGQPAIIIRDRLSTMERLLSQLVIQENYDVVHADQTSMAQYALHAQKAAPSAEVPATMLDQHNALFLLFARQSSYEPQPWRAFWRREARVLADYERKMLLKFDEIVTVTREDKQALLSLLPEDDGRELETKITPIPICVDPASQTMLEPVTNGRQIVHLGTMFWPPNVEGVLWFVREVLPIVWREMPDVRLLVAGKNPPEEVRALTRNVNALGGGVVVTGFVEDPLPLLARSQVFIVPVRAGGGMRVKIVDAWLWGVPIVSTTIGAEGIDIRDGETVILADEPDQFAAAILRLLSDRTLAERMRIAGRDWVEKRYDYKKVYREFDSVYERLAR
jgi:glycosyltransferase involved in cell wall biosynthesis